MNKKEIGDMGCNCVIGELAKYGVGVAFPLSDNYPFDIIALAGNSLFKVQVKSSSSLYQGAIAFKLTTSNFHNGKKYNYSSSEIDIFALYDLVNYKAYLVPFKDTIGKSTFNIRIMPPKRKIAISYNYAENYIISKERIREIFKFEQPDFINNIHNKEHKRYKNKIHNCICKACNKEFSSEEYGSKYCSRECLSFYQQKVPHPTKEQLIEDLNNSSMVKLGLKYGVSGNTIKKWANKYTIDCQKTDNDKWVWSATIS